MVFHVPEKCRVNEGHYGSTIEWGNNGLFVIKTLNLKAVVSDGGGWDHVSVTSVKGSRYPTWEEMCKVKDLFWDDEDSVIQYHPPKSEYVNNHSKCLHLWCSQDYEFPRPPPEMVGYKELGNIE